MKIAILICIGGFLCLKLIARRVWYRQEHLRPGYLRHPFILQTVDLVANLFLVAIIFLMLNTDRWLLTLLLTAGLIGCDYGLCQLFLYWEARRICAHSPEWSLRSAKQRIQKRLKREITGA